MERLWAFGLAVIMPLALINEWDSVVDLAHWW